LQQDFGRPMFLEHNSFGQPEPQICTARTRPAKTQSTVRTLRLVKEISPDLALETSSSPPTRIPIPSSSSASTPTTGRLTPTGQSVEVSIPTCITFVPIQ
jgi:hypothetical protein